MTVGKCVPCDAPHKAYVVFSDASGLGKTILKSCIPPLLTLNFGAFHSKFVPFPDTREEILNIRVTMVLFNKVEVQSKSKL